MKNLLGLVVSGYVSIEATAQACRDCEDAGVRRDMEAGRLNIAVLIDDLDRVSPEVFDAGIRPRVELDCVHLVPERIVELTLELVAHHEVRRQRREGDDESDDAGRHERQAGPKSHGSRST